MGQLDPRLRWLGEGREGSRRRRQRSLCRAPPPARCCPTCLQWSALRLPGRFPTHPTILFPRVPSSEPSSPHSTYKSKRISTQDFNTTYNLVTLRFPSSLSYSTTYCSSPFRGPTNNSRGNMHKSSIVILPPNYSCNIPTSRL